MTTTAQHRPAGVEDDSWTDTNQRHLLLAMEEVSLALARHLGVEPPEVTGHGDGRESLAPRLDRVPPPALDHRPPPDGYPPPALDALTSAFALSPFERSVLVMCAGVELDASFAALCSPGPSFGLALAALPAAHWSALTPHAPLRRWRLVEVSGNASLTTAALRIDEHVLHLLAGVGGPDTKLTGVLTPCDVGSPTTPGQARAAERLAACWQVPDGAVPVLAGADRASRLAVAVEAAAAVGLTLSLLDPRVLPSDAAGREELARLLERMSVLTGTAFVLDSDSDPGDVGHAAVDAAVSQTRAPLVVSSAEGLALRTRASMVVDVPRATAAEQRDLWRRWLGPEAPIEPIVAAFDFDATTIRAATDAATTAGIASAEELWSICRAVDRPQFSGHAYRIASRAGWDDLVLPEPQLSALRLLAAHARHRVTVYEDWGMDQGRTVGLGNTSIFGGPSGTGKTFAAEVIANELGLDLYRVDLSAVVSKYIGETEKNLRQLFDAADHGAAVLLFDEADALFGKRTEVRDSHDRYANVEVSYLLQRLEAYRGLAILTTNLAEAIDSAFLRRVRFVVSFPFPDERLRAQLWARAFPPGVPVDDLNPDALARLDVTGGTIRNIAVNAAFLAAEHRRPVGMRYVIQAARVEAAKLGQPLPSLRWETT